ncbi:MAG: DUF3429 family protein [Wenzhouxiangella sp.]
MESHVKTARITGWISVAPLLGLPLIAWLGAPGWLSHLLTGWGAMLLAFWAGSLWVRHLDGQPQRTWMLVASLALVLAAWPAVLLPFHLAMFWLTALHGVHLFIDEPWRSQGRSGWYRRLRLVLAVLAIALLAVSGMIGLTYAG